MHRELFPVPCPQCGESQNVTLGSFDPDANPFGPVICMICGRPFSCDEYLAGLEARLRALEKMASPSVAAVPANDR